MNGIALAVCTFINENTSLKDMIYFDIFPTPEGEGVICRHDPSRSQEKVYIDGSRVGECNLSFYARSKNASRDRDMLCEVQDALDNAHIESGAVIIDVENVSEPQFVSVDDKGQVLYTASVVSRFMIGGEKENLFN